jgi:hypothetical protein
VTLDNVGAIQLESLHHNKKRRHHKRHNFLQTEYVSPFGMDSQHGYGGNDQKRLESLIDKGQNDDENLSSDDEK